MTDSPAGPGERASERIAAFLASRFPGTDIGPADDIFAMGFVNSLFAMELVLFIESAFGFTIANEDLRLDNFRTVAAMTALVLGQRAAAAPVGEP
jgi:acyl carrier protein